MFHLLVIFFLFHFAYGASSVCITHCEINLEAQNQVGQIATNSSSDME